MEQHAVPEPQRSNQPASGASAIALLMVGVGTLFTGLGAIITTIR